MLCNYFFLFNQGDKIFYAEKTFKEGENDQFLHAEQNRGYYCDQLDEIDLVSMGNMTQFNMTLQINKIDVQPFENGGTLTSKTFFCLQFNQKLSFVKLRQL